MKAIEVAAVEVGKEEVPRGSNWGGSIIKYLQAVGINCPAAWCAAFVHWCTDQAAGISSAVNPLFTSGSVLAMWKQTAPEFKLVPANVEQTSNGKDEPLPIGEPVAGDIFIMDFGGGLGHCGFIESVSADGRQLHTIEGNTNNDGSREGYAVEKKIRNLPNAKIIGYIRTGL